MNSTVGGLVADFGKIDMAASMNHNFTYSWNASFSVGNRYGTDKQGVSRITQIAHSSYKIILDEEAHPNDGWSFVGWLFGYGGVGDDTPAFRHAHRANWGFADGHVDTYGPFRNDGY